MYRCVHRFSFVVLCGLISVLAEDIEFRRLLLTNNDMNPFRYESRQVTLTNGLIVGTTDGASDAYMGIPFALSPTGDRRFMRPVSIKDLRWEGVRATRKTSQMCIQRSVFFASTPVVGDEDCLYLNVYRPTEATAVDLPVMVFIHGGAFSVGSSYWLDGQFDGSNLARDEKVIVVAMNYRLNLFGFFATEQLSDANGGTVGNLALQDQQEALRWVKREIQNFGGDPNRITLFGESAGGFSVIWHTVNVHSRREDLFQAAIVQSATTDLSWFFQSKEDAFQLYAAFSSYLGCPSDAPGQLSCLQAIPALQLLPLWTSWSKLIFTRAQHSGDAGGQPNNDAPLLHHPETVPLLHLLCAFGPVIDGSEDGLAQLPRTLIKRGEFHRVPLVAGITRDEGSLFALLIPLIVGSAEKTPMTSAQWREISELILQKPAAIQELYRLYPLQKIRGYLGVHSWATEVIRDLAFGCSTEELVEDWATFAPAWMYLFSATLGPVGKFSGVGSMHSFDLHYVFKNFFPGFSLIAGSRELAIANEMSSRWAQFARARVPTVPGQLEWPEYSVDKKFLDIGFSPTDNGWASYLGFTQYFSKETPSRLVDRESADKDLWPEKPKCAFWQSQIPLPWIPHKQGWCVGCNS